MKYEAHDYQKYTTEYIENHDIAAIFLDCGLGKSVIMLTAISDLLFDSFEIHKILVVAPLRVARDTWPGELEKWEHLRHLTYSVAVGSETQRKAALLQKADIYIINRENVEWLVTKSGLSFDYDMLVVDELSSFKSYQAKRFRSLSSVRPKVKRVVGLTGTPSSNGLMDLWAEFRLLDMGKRLGRFITYFRGDYFVPDKRNQQIVFSYKPKPGAEEAIYRLVSDITISMKSTDYLKMPECIINEVPVRLSDKEMECYQTLKDDLILSLDGEDIDAQSAVGLSNKLTQMANGAVYGEDGKVIAIHDRKLDALEDLIEAANGKSVLIAYWYRHDLERIQTRLHKLHIPFSMMDTCREHQPLESRRTACDPHPSGFGGTWLESTGGRLHPHLVRTDMESGTVSANQRTSLAAGAEGYCCYSPHHHQRHD